MSITIDRMPSCLDISGVAGSLYLFAGNQSLVSIRINFDEARDKQMDQGGVDTYIHVDSAAIDVTP